MKNYFRIAPLFLLAMFCFFGEVQAKEVNPQAKILSLEGQVRIKNPGGAQWSNAQKGTDLKEGSEILTGAKSWCDLAVGEHLKNVVKIQPDSKATLESLEPVKIDLQSGKIFSLVQSLRKGSTFEVSSPTAVAVARGTGWGESANSISVFEDTVHVTGTSGQESNVPEGKGVQVSDDGKLGEKFDVTDEARSEWSEFKEDAEKSIEGLGKEDMGGGSDQEALIGQEERSQGAQDNLMDAKDSSNESKDQGRIDDKLSGDTTKINSGNY